MNISEINQKYSVTSNIKNSNNNLTNNKIMSPSPSPPPPPPPKKKKQNKRISKMSKRNK